MTKAFAPRTVRLLVLASISISDLARVVLSPNWGAAVELSDRQRTYPFVESFFQAMNLIGFYKTDSALRHIALDIPQTHAQRLLNVIRSIAIPSRVADILSDRVLAGLDLIAVADTAPAPSTSS